MAIFLLLYLAHCAQVQFFTKKKNAITNLIRKIICATSFISSTFVRISEYCSVAAHSTVSKVSCTRTNICRWLKNISFFFWTITVSNFQTQTHIYFFCPDLFLFIFSKIFDQPTCSLYRFFSKGCQYKVVYFKNRNNKHEKK